MKSLWTNKWLLLILLPCLAWAQEPEATEPADPKPSQMDMEAVEMGKRLGKVIKKLRAFQPWEAHKLLEDAKLPSGLKYLLEGWAYHQEGDYKKASRAFEKVDKDQLSGDPYFSNRFEELSKTAAELADFTVLETENFSFRYQEGPDQAMIYYLQDIMEEVYARYAKLFKYVRDEKIIVELMPDHRLFSYASALTREQIETTGTIALCVENRLVVLTPRRVLQGYYWPDVIAHEFVHYILTKQSADNVPLWMQEGVAKYFEARWEREDINPLEPSLETSLALAIKDDSLLTVDQMMPSFAALPTAQLARQAYAQTAAMIDYLCKTKTEDIVHRIVVSLREEPDMDKVMQTHLGQNFDGFESSWRAWLKTQNYQEFDHIKEMGVSLLDEDAPVEKIEDLEKADQKHKKHLRLGDLLLERNRYGAALRQYEKTRDQSGKLSRQLVLRMLMCHSNLRQFQEMIDVIDNNVTDVENDVTMLVYKAEAQMGQQQNTRAEMLLERAIRINPFNPNIYQNLILLEQEAGNEMELEKLKKVMEALTSPARPQNKETKS